MPALTFTKADIVAFLSKNALPVRLDTKDPDHSELFVGDHIQILMRSHHMTLRLQRSSDVWEETGCATTLNNLLNLVRVALSYVMDQESKGAYNTEDVKATFIKWFSHEYFMRRDMLELLTELVNDGHLSTASMQTILDRNGVGA